MLKAPLFDRQGKRAGDVDLFEGLFGGDVNFPVLHQKVVMEQNAQRQGTSETKTRGQVAGGSKKPFRQKGTGRARQGTISAPHFRSGGIVFGPHPRGYDQKMPKKMRVAALRSALSGKAGMGEVLVIEEFTLSKISTKEADALLAQLDFAGKGLLVIAEYDETVLKSVRNLPYLKLRIAADVSARDIVNGGQIILTRAALGRMEEAWGK